MSAETKTRLDAATAAHDESETALSAAKAALAADPSDPKTLNRREIAQRERDRAAMVLEAATTAHGDAETAEANAKAAADEAERKRLIAESSFATMHTRIAPAIAELVAMESRACGLIKGILDELRAADARHRRATRNAAGAPMTETHAIELCREQVRQARLTRSRIHDPNVAPWVDVHAWQPAASHTSPEIEARDIARRVLGRKPNQAA